MKLGPQPVLVITGAEYNRQFYSETDKALNMQDGYGFLKEAIGEVLFTASPEDYYNQRPALQEVFKRERMIGYIEAMNVEVQSWLELARSIGRDRHHAGDAATDAARRRTRLDRTELR